MMPMTIDPMVPEMATLLAITPAFLGVLVALLAAVALAIRGTLHELERPATPRIVAARPILPTPAHHLAA
jgi:hypothetical protein